MQTLKYSARLLTAFISRFKAVLVFGILIGATFFAAARFLLPAFSGSNQRIGIEGRYFTNSLPRFIQEMLSDGLTSIDDAGNITPNLAASWETPDKGKTWVFNLDQEKTWQDGEKISSHDIKYEFEDVQIEKTDDKTIVFKLEETFSPFPSVVSVPVFKKGLLGTGEWRVDKITVAGGIVQELSVENVNSGTSFFSKKQKITFRFYPTTERTKLAYKLGQVDRIIDLLDPDPFQTWSSTSEIHRRVNYNQAVTIFLNNQDPVLSDKSLRQALNYAIDKKEMGERSISPISPKSWAYNPQVKRYEYDRQRAVEIIDELPDELIKELEIKLTTTPVLLPLAENVARAWNDVGINTTVQVSSIIPSEFQAFMTIYDFPYDPDQYAMWHSTQNDSNITSYTNQRIDKLLEDGRTTLDTEERKRIYLDFQRFLLEDSPAIFLVHPYYYDAGRK